MKMNGCNVIEMKLPGVCRLALTTETKKAIRMMDARSPRKPREH